MRTEELIVQLVGEATPVRRLERPSVRAIRWVAVMTATAAVAVFVMQPRQDLPAALQDSAYAARALSTAATAMLAAAMSLVLSVPGAERSRYQRALPFLALASWTLVLGAVLGREGNAVARLETFPVNPGCIYQIVALSAIPAASLLWMVRRAAPLSPGWNALLAGLAAAAFGAASTQLLCPVDDAAHQLVGHVVPAMTLAGAIAIVGRLLLHRFSVFSISRPVPKRV